MIIEENSPLTGDTDSLKLIKNSKGYNWEIKMREIDVLRMASINADMILKFGKEMNL